MSETIPEASDLAAHLATVNAGRAVIEIDTKVFISREVCIEAMRSERDRATAAEREACAKRVWDWRDYDGSTGDDYDLGYGEAVRDALAAIRNPMEGRGPEPALDKPKFDAWWEHD